MDIKDYEKLAMRSLVTMALQRGIEVIEPTFSLISHPDRAKAWKRAMVYLFFLLDRGDDVTLAITRADFICRVKCLPPIENVPCKIFELAKREAVC